MLGDTRIHAGIPTHATQDTSKGEIITRTGLSPSKASHSRLFPLNYFTLVKKAIHYISHCWDSVWTNTCSIASTNVISIDFSSFPYWDVSLRGVPHPYGLYLAIWEVLLGYLRITDSLRLPADFRSLARPSSALKPNHPLTGVKTRIVLINKQMHQRFFVFCCWFSSSSWYYLW